MDALLHAATKQHASQIQNTNKGSTTSFIHIGEYLLLADLWLNGAFRTTLCFLDQ